MHMRVRREIVGPDWRGPTVCMPPVLVRFKPTPTSVPARTPRCVAYTLPLGVISAVGVRNTAAAVICRVLNTAAVCYVHRRGTPWCAG